MIYTKSQKNKFIDLLCDEIISSPSGLNKIVMRLQKSYDGQVTGCNKFPCTRTLLYWIGKYDSFAKKYFLAKSVQIEQYMSQHEDITFELINDDSLSIADVNRLREAARTIEWRAQRLKSSVYGSATDIKLAELRSMLEEVERNRGKKA